VTSPIPDGIRGEGPKWADAGNAYVVGRSLTRRREKATRQIAPIPQRSSSRSAGQVQGGGG